MTTGIFLTGLVPILIDETQIKAIRSEIPELPAEKFKKHIPK